MHGLQLPSRSSFFKGWQGRSCLMESVRMVLVCRTQCNVNPIRPALSVSWTFKGFLLASSATRAAFSLLITQRSVIQIHPPQPSSNSTASIGSDRFSKCNLAAIGTLWLPFVDSALRDTVRVPPQIADGNRLRTTTLFAARLPSDMALV